MPLRLPAAHVQSGLGNHRLNSAGLHPVNARQVHAGHPLQFRLQIELRLIAGRLSILLPSSLGALVAGIRGRLARRYRGIRYLLHHCL